MTPLCRRGMDAEKVLFAGLHFSSKKAGDDRDRNKQTSASLSKTTPVAKLTNKTRHGLEGQEGQPPCGRDKLHRDVTKSALKRQRKDSGKRPRAAPDNKKARERSIEEVALLRKKHRIHASGADVPAPLQTFGELQKSCGATVMANLSAMGYQDPTPIQRQAIPVLLAGRDCLACAPTGSGKTVAFLLPMLATLKAPAKDGIRAVVLSPTRELAKQTQRELKLLAAGKKLRVRLMTKAMSVCVDLSSTPCDILVSTPLRLNRMSKAGKVNLSRVQHLVLDEADKLFEFGFAEQIDEVLAACKDPGVVRSMFSATLPETVEALARTVMQDPVRVVVGERNTAVETVEQKLLFVGSEGGKLLAMRQMFQQGLRPPVLVFVQSKDRAKQLHRELTYDGVNVDVIHADRSQAKREAVVNSFRAGKTWVLIATDLMARGIDVKGVSCVINYDFPQSTAAYIHRVGRTGRAGRRGEAVTLYTEDDALMLRPIANVVVASGGEVPQWMLTMPKPRRQRRGVPAAAPDRKPITTVAKVDLQRIKRRRDMVEASKRRKEAARVPQDGF